MHPTLFFKMPALTHTTVLIILTVIVSFLAWQDKKIMGRFIFDPLSITRFKQYDRFITHGFVHKDGMHLLFNMFTLYFFGRIIEQFYIIKFGLLGFVLFYVLAIIVAIIPTYIKYKNHAHYLGLGASGGVSAVLFAFILFYPWEVIYLFAVIPIPAIIFAGLYTAYSIYMDKNGRDNVNHSAHLVGALFGVVATIICEPRLIFHFGKSLLTPNLF